MFNTLCELRMHMTPYAILYDVNIVLVLPPRFCGLPCPSNFGNLESGPDGIRILHILTIKIMGQLLMPEDDTLLSTAGQNISITSKKNSVL